ncbi:MAG TPA: glycosyltransferase family 39 protein, partial [Planctomycetia bacterium]|nr:glycosyltransferase family 39 protein [Planctomycetia bacterium]
MILNRLPAPALAAAGIAFALWLVFAPFSAHPTNDDFLYARSAEILAREGRYVAVAHNGQAPAAALFPVALAALAIKVCGYSFRLLHLLQALVAAAGAFAAWKLVRDLRQPRAIGVAAALALVASPWMFGQVFTFMTDAPAAALLVVAISCFCAALFRDSPGAWIAGGVAAGLAVATRQTSLVVILFPIAALVIARRLGAPARLSPWMVLAIALPVLAALLPDWFGFGPPQAERAAFVRRRDFSAPQLKAMALALYGAALVVGVGSAPLLPLLIYRPFPFVLRTRVGKAIVLAGLLPFLALAA